MEQYYDSDQNPNDGDYSRSQDYLSIFLNDDDYSHFLSTQHHIRFYSIEACHHEESGKLFELAAWAKENCFPFQLEFELAKFEDFSLSNDLLEESRIDVWGCY